MPESRPQLTLLFTDIEGSTRLWEDEPAAMSVSLARHDNMVRAAIEDAGGSVFKTVGDAFCAVFPAAAAAVSAAVGIQQAAAAEPWSTETPIRVRIGMHSGVCEERDADYFGPTVNRVARLEAAAHGGQTVLSGATAALLGSALPSGVSLRDLGEHRLKDLGQPERVFQVCADGLRPDFPPLRSLDNPALRHNLPAQVSSFVGREAEVATLRKMLSDGRLVTVAGPGGVGKTRLALQVAVELLDGSGDGVWLVELAPLADPALVFGTVANVLGVRLEPARPPADSLLDWLRDRSLLLVLDNCEHLIDAAAAVADAVLRRCPGVVVMATSREPLGIGGEKLYRIPSLPVPPEEEGDPSELGRFAAVRLFTERAAEHRAEFTMDGTNAAAVAAVVRRLDGIPLALELAAARLRSQSIGDLESRLDQRFRLLTGGSRTALPRQRTLQALIDWSYELLSAQEQSALERLSVFSGGFDQDAAVAVCASGKVEEFEIVDLLGVLVDKSLVQAEEAGPNLRYRQLETVRAYAAAKLSERGKSAVSGVRDAHRDHYLEVAESSLQGLKGAEQLAWLDRLEAEHDNLRGALAHCSDDPDPELGLRLAAALGRFRSIRGHTAESVAALDAQLSRPGAHEPTLARGQALVEVAEEAAFNAGSYATATVRSEEAFAIARSHHDDHLAAEALLAKASALQRQGQLEAALNVANETLAIARPQGDAHLLARAHRVKGLVLMDGHHGGMTSFEEAIRLFRQAGDGLLAAGTLGNVGVAELDAGDLQNARTHLNQAREFAREFGHARQTVIMSINLGLAAHLDGDDAAAQQILEDALDGSRRLRDDECILYALLDLALIATSSGNPTQATLVHGAVDALLERLGEQFEPLESRLRDEDHHLLRGLLGNDAFEAAREVGRARPLDEVITQVATSS
jgi:predicted ATPase/class 3 adenylate cyclase